MKNFINHSNLYINRELVLIDEVGTYLNSHFICYRLEQMTA